MGNTLSQSYPLLYQYPYLYSYSSTYNKLEDFVKLAVGVDRYGRGYSKSELHKMTAYAERKSIIHLDAEEIMILYAHYKNINEPLIHNLIEEFICV